MYYYDLKINQLNGLDVWALLNWLDQRGYSYEYELDEFGEGEVIEGYYYSDGHYTFSIEDFTVVWTDERLWD